MALAQDGNVSKLNKGRPQVLMAKVMQRTPIMFITIPDLAMSKTWR